MNLNWFSARFFGGEVGTSYANDNESSNCVTVRKCFDLRRGVYACQGKLHPMQLLYELPNDSQSCIPEWYPNFYYSTWQLPIKLKKYENLYLYCIAYLLTYSMVQSPSWEANWSAVSQEIPRISRNPKVHYCTHKRPPPVSILGQPNPVHTHTSCCAMFPLETLLPPPRRSEWGSSLPPDCFVSRASIPHVSVS